VGSGSTAPSSSSPATCPGISEIVPLLIIIKLEQFDYAGATVIAALMLVASFILLFTINLLQAWTRRQQGG